MASLRGCWLATLGRLLLPPPARRPHRCSIDRNNPLPLSFFLSSTTQLRERVEKQAAAEAKGGALAPALSKHRLKETAEQLHSELGRSPRGGVSNRAAGVGSSESPSAAHHRPHKMALRPPPEALNPLHAHPHSQVEALEAGAQLYNKARSRSSSHPRTTHRPKASEDRKGSAAPAVASAAAPVSPVANADARTLI